MFLVHHPAFLPVTAADNHCTPAGTYGHHEHNETAHCHSLVEAPGVTFACTRYADHDGHHQAALLTLPARMPGVRTMQPVTPDTLVIAAEWDDARGTDGMA